MEVAIFVVGAIGLFGILKVFVALTVFEHHKHNSQYRHEEERHTRTHVAKMREYPRYFI